MLHLYSKGSCINCQKAKQLLTNKGIEFRESIIGIHVMRESFVDMFPNAKTVPLILNQHADGFLETIGGYDQLVEYLDTDRPSASELLQG